MKRIHKCAGLFLSIFLFSSPLSYAQANNTQEVRKIAPVSDRMGKVADTSNDNDSDDEDRSEAQLPPNPSRRGRRASRRRGASPSANIAMAANSSENNLVADVVANIVDPTPSKSLVDKINAGTIALPTALAGLPIINTETTNYSLDEALAFGLPVGQADGKLSRRIFVQNFVQYKEIKEGDETVWYGVGIRWIVNAKTLDANAKLNNSIPFLAASAEVRSVEASSRFQVIGLTSAEITNAVEIPMDLNVDSYVKLFAAFQKLKGLMNNPNTVVAPQIIARLVDVKPNSTKTYTDALTIGWALARLADGKTLQEAQDNYPNFAPGTSNDVLVYTKNLIKNVYEDVSKTQWNNAASKPDPVAIAQAKALVQKLKLGK